jgi:putative membrane protein
VDEIGVSAHQDAVKLFEKASNDVKDPDVKQFAIETLPVLQQHLEMATAMQQRLDAAKK